MNTEDVKLDPRKFDNDMLEETQEPTDDEVFDGIYNSGLSVPEHSVDYQKWLAWLRENRPGSRPHR
ncbi:hypothetical protein LBW59_24300 [Ralstonia solanacearum]|uniref:Uncharacterized protein n=1 Tax=Ralstonia solanacearum TaxID=305 RepID=A0AAW5ZVV0_RALSL|nr:hypothetical protein [Ralstonia solanacearum]MDB0573869.1 hypothetical protein [Ralstonia solanacearum]